MREVKKINIKNPTYYFYNEIINLKTFESGLLKIDKKHYKEINIYYISNITIKEIDDCESIYSVNPLYLLVNHANGYIEEKGVNKYLIFDSTDENKELLKKYNDVWNGIKNKIEEVSSGECDYEKDYMKIKFNSDDDLPLNKPLKFHAMTIIIRSVFEEDDKLYQQIFLDDTLHELVSECYSTKELMFQKELMLIKQVCQKNVNFVIIGFSKMLDLNLKSMFVMDVMIY